MKKCEICGVPECECEEPFTSIVRYNKEYPVDDLCLNCADVIRRAKYNVETIINALHYLMTKKGSHAP